MAWNHRMDAILVTGGAGFIGSALVRLLLAERDCAVVVLDKLTYASGRDTLADPLRDSRLTFVQGDIADGPLVRRLLREHRPGAIAHLAAESHVDRSIDAPAAFVQTNVVGSCQLLEATLEYLRELPVAEREAFRFLHVSTDEVYGSAEAGAKFTESSRYAPNSPYAASKAAADHFVRAYHATYGLPAIVTHSSNNYGPYQHPEKLIPLMTLSALTGRPLPVYGDGQQVRDWLHVDDHCRALLAVLERGRVGESYNIGGSCERTNLQVVEAICDAMDGWPGNKAVDSARCLIRFVADRPGHDRRYALDASKLTRELGWRPERRFEEALAATVRWYVEHRGWAAEASRAQAASTRLGLALTPGVA